MKTVPFGIAELALLASGLFGFFFSVRAQDDGEPQLIVSRAISATIDYGNDVIFQPAKHGTDFEQPGGGVFGQGGGWRHSYRWSCSATENSTSAPDSYTVHYPDDQWVTFDANPGTPYLAPPGVDRSIRWSLRRRLRQPQSDRPWRGSVLARRHLSPSRSPASRLGGVLLFRRPTKSLIRTVRLQHTHTRQVS